MKDGAVVTLYRSPRVLYQAADDDHGLPEEAIAASLDASGLIVLGQSGGGLVINRATVPALVKVLRALKSTGDESEPTP